MTRFAAAVLLATVVHAAPAAAAMYRYEDETGAANFVDDPSKIPERYRGSARAYEPAPLATTRDVTPVPKKAPEKSGWLSFADTTTAAEVKGFAARAAGNRLAPVALGVQALFIVALLTALPLLRRKFYLDADYGKVRAAVVVAFVLASAALHLFLFAGEIFPDQPSTPPAAEAPAPGTK